MNKKVWLISSSMIFLTACNDDKTNIVTTPDYKEPKIIIVGHRGASALRPEHTLESYQKPLTMVQILLNLISSQPKMVF